MSFQLSSNKQTCMLSSQRKVYAFGPSGFVKRSLKCFVNRKASSKSKMCVEFPDINETITNIHKDKMKTVIYATGGGSQAISWLLSVPGASNTILEASVPYSRKSFIDILGKEPKQYCSMESAMDLAKAAFRRAAELSDFNTTFVGIGASCALATGTPKRGPHRAFIALHGPEGSRVLGLDLAKDFRSRAQEEDLVSRAMVQLLSSVTAPPTGSKSESEFESESAVKSPGVQVASTGVETTVMAQAVDEGPDSTGGAADVSALVLPPSFSPTAACGLPGWERFPGDAFIEASSDAYRPTSSSSASFPLPSSPGGDSSSSPSPSSSPSFSFSPSPFSSSSSSSPSSPALSSAIDLLVQGKARCVEVSRSGVLIDAPRSGRLYLPGSFNPLHDGHKQLLAAALRASAMEEGAFELAIGNADKGVLPSAEVLRRVEQFRAAGLPVVLTTAPLFNDKARLLPGSAFVVGFDTAVRMVMPKYYGNSHAQMLADFALTRHLGCSFIVGGRREDAAASTPASPSSGASSSPSSSPSPSSSLPPVTSASSTIGGSPESRPPPRFLTLADVDVPPELKDLFRVGLLEADFRVDLSSTELRRRAALDRHDKEI